MWLFSVWVYGRRYVPNAAATRHEEPRPVVGRVAVEQPGEEDQEEPEGDRRCSTIRAGLK